MKYIIVFSVFLYFERKENIFYGFYNKTMIFYSFFVILLEKMVVYIIST